MTTGLMLSVGLLVPVPAAGAVTAEASPAVSALVPSGDIPLGEPVSTTSSRDYTNVPIPAGITELTIRYGPGNGAVSCYLTTTDPEDEIGWRHDDPVPDVDVIDVVQDRVVAGGTYLLTCRVATGDDHWSLVAALPPAGTATISAIDSPYLTAINESVVYPRTHLTFTVGGQYRFVGAAGALPAGQIFGLMIYDADEYDAIEGSVTADRSTAIVTMDPWIEWQTHDVGHVQWGVNFDVRGPAGTRDGVPVTRHAQWGGAVTVLPAPSAIKVATSSAVATSINRIKANIRVTAPDFPIGDWYEDQPGRGNIVVKVDGRQVAHSTLYTGWLGRWVVTLPRLPRGLHRVTAEYTGWTWIAPSVSTTATVRVLV
ncbi:MAG: hypothetical protein ABWZ98_06495 [Nakamurella sp.]